MAVKKSSFLWTWFGCVNHFGLVLMRKGRPFEWPQFMAYTWLIIECLRFNLQSLWWKNLGFAQLSTLCPLISLFNDLVTLWFLVSCYNWFSFCINYGGVIKPGSLFHCFHFCSLHVLSSSNCANLAKEPVYWRTRSGLYDSGPQQWQWLSGAVALPLFVADRATRSSFKIQSLPSKARTSSSSSLPGN